VPVLIWVALLWGGGLARAQTITWDASPSGGTPNATALELIQDTATPTPSGQYIGLRFSSSTPLTNVYVQATVAGAGFSLDATEAATRFVGNLTSVAQTSYWYINQLPSGNGTFQLRLYLGNPAAGGTLQATSPLYTLTNSDVDQAASANKITSVVVNGGNAIQLGQSFNVVVNYIVNSAGPNLIVQPAALASFDPFNLRLGATKVELCSDTACSTVTSTLNNQLYFTNVGGNVNGVRATYTFQTVGTVSVALSPIVVARSGQYKYNPDFATPAVNTTVPAPVNRVKITKSVNIIQSDVGTTVTYTLTASNSGSATVSLDELEDTLPSSPANASYVVGSSRLNGAAFANPVISGQVLSWRASGNQFTVPAGGSFALSFQATLPGTNGTYTNRAIGRINGNVIGSTETLNSAPATASTRVGQPVSVTGSLFNDLDRNGARDTGEDAFTTGTATVTLTNTSTNQTLTTTTATGSYAFSDVPAGTYNVTVSVPGYQVTTPARTVTVGTSNVIVADIGLAQNPTSQPCSVVYAGGFGTSTSAATAPYSIYPVDTSAGVAGTALFAVPYQTAAFARDPVTGRFYYIENATGTTSARVGYYDPATGAVPTSATTTITKSGGDSGNFTRFAFNSAGVGYASMGSNNAMYRLDLSNGGNTVTVTRLGVIQGLPSNTSGDFAFSASGILRLLTNGVLYRIELSDLTADQVFNTGNNTINGAAFDATGNFYVSNTTTLFRVNLGTGEFTQIGTGLGSTALSADLGSCAYPTFTTTVSVSKTVAPTGSVTPGTILTYTVTVTNSGNALATKTTLPTQSPPTRPTWRAAPRSTVRRSPTSTERCPTRAAVLFRAPALPTPKVRSERARPPSSPFRYG